MVMIGFWVVFAAFFRGLTYGLLQISQNERSCAGSVSSGCGWAPMSGRKVTILVPFLFIVVIAMLGVLRIMDRLPSRPMSTYASMGISLLLCAVAAPGLGLLTSAMVGNVAQATLALPMLCFPAVLFSGVILLVNLMAGAGAGLSTVIPSWWAFEAIGHDLGPRRISPTAPRLSGRRCSSSYGDAGRQSTGTYWLMLAVLLNGFPFATWRAAWSHHAHIAALVRCRDRVVVPVVGRDSGSCGSVFLPTGLALDRMQNGRFLNRAQVRAIAAGATVDRVALGGAAARARPRRAGLVRPTELDPRRSKPLPSVAHRRGERSSVRASSSEMPSDAIGLIPNPEVPTFSTSCTRARRRGCRYRRRPVGARVRRQSRRCRRRRCG